MLVASMGQSAKVNLQTAKVEAGQESVLFVLRTYAANTTDSIDSDARKKKPVSLLVETLGLFGVPVGLDMLYSE